MSNPPVSRRAFLSTGAVTIGGLLVPRFLSQPRTTDPGVPVTLEAAYGRTAVGNSSAYLYCYNGQAAGPVIETAPGASLRIELVNRLSEPTNLHFHGLHVSPDGNSDNPFLEIPPGESLVYDLEIPPDHPAGTFWYHPHLHGRVAHQVSMGLSGFLIIRGGLDDYPEMNPAQEYLLMLKDFSIGPTGYVIAPTMMDRMQGREGNLLTVNGQIQPSLAIPENGLVRLRLLNASSSRFYHLRLQDHPMHIIALDGLALSETQTVDEILLAPGQRADVLISGDRPPGRYALLNLPYDRGGMGMGMGMMSRRGATPGGATTLAQLTYEGRADRIIPVPYRLGSVPMLEPPNLPPRRFVLSEGMGGMGMGFFINGRSFDHHRVDTRVRLNSTEEWEIVNTGMMDHPFHIHTNPFQVLASPGDPGVVWRDTLIIPHGQTKRIRIRFADFAGRTVYHCHILDHEDLGMMGTLEMA